MCHHRSGWRRTWFSGISERSTGSTRGAPASFSYGTSISSPAAWARPQQGLDSSSRGSSPIDWIRLPELQPDSSLSALENVEMPLQLDGVSPSEYVRRSGRLLARMVSPETRRFPRLSGGQRQRVTIARGLVGNRSVIARQPTGALDSHTGERIMLVLRILLRCWCSRVFS